MIFFSLIFFLDFSKLFICLFVCVISQDRETLPKMKKVKEERRISLGFFSKHKNDYPTLSIYVTDRGGEKQPNTMIST